MKLFKKNTSLNFIIVSLILGYTSITSFGEKSYKNIFVKENKETLNLEDNFISYVDGVSKVYLNDIDDEEITEDRWKYNEVKTIRVKANMDNLDKGEKYLKIELPIGMQLNVTPESLIDNRNILSVDTSNFNKVKLDTNNSNKYSPKTGTLVYSISDDVSKLSVDILVSIDNTLWNTVEDSLATSENDKAIKVSIGDNKKVFSKKLDKVYVCGKNWNGVYSTIHSSTMLLDKDVRIEGRLGLDTDTNPNNKLYKKVVSKIEIPYTEVISNGVVTKKKASIKNLTLSDNGTYTIDDDWIILEWNNAYMKRWSFNLDIYFDSSIFLDNELIKFRTGEMYVQDYFSDKLTKMVDEDNKTSRTISKDREFISTLTHSKSVYLNPNITDRKNLTHMGAYQIVNNGELTADKYLKFEFPTNAVGIKTVKLPTLKEAGVYTIKYVLWNSKTKQEYNGEIEINKPSGNNATGYTFTVSKAIEGIFLPNGTDTSSLYFKSIEYCIGKIPYEYDSGALWATYSPGGSGNIYGTLLEDAILGEKYYFKYSLGTIDPKTNDIEFNDIKQSHILITENGESTMGITSFNYYNENNKITNEVVAGDTFYMKGIADVSSYPYFNTTYISNPVIHIRVPKGIIIDESKTVFKIKNNDISELLEYEIRNKNNPRELSDGTIVYDIKITSDNFSMGYYKENLSTIGQLDYNVACITKKSLRTTSLNVRETLFIMDESIKMTGCGSWNNYFVNDTMDINGNGNISERLSTLDSDKYLSIVSNTTWLDVDISSEGSSDNGNKDYQPIEDTSDIIKYGLTINNNNDGYVRTGKMEYFIPVPKKDVEYNSYVKEDGGTFNFDMELTEKVEDTLGFDISYTYNNEDYLSYSDDLDLNRVSMIKVINNRDISPGETFEFKVSMKYSEDSWSGDENINSWNMYGQQTYEKNGTESTFLHVLDTFKVELLINPKILKNPESKSVKVGESVTFSTNIDVGIPIAIGNWQYRESSSDTWKDLNETSTTLSIDNVSYNINGYEYRYVATNKGATVESLPATLTVTDKEGPIITLNEFKDGDVYKITITAIDNGSGISHIILPDGSRVNSNTYTMIADVNTEYTFKVYDLAGNESIKSTMIGVIVPNTITSNLDVYIKSENLLSLSLDTNNITFDDFSGIEDLEKTNAINLTINSSLPYSINAYLPTEVQNSDKSKTMNKEILNIKENSETNYKNFANINEKVVLKDNCSAGNRLNHGIDIKLKGRVAHEKDVYKTTIKFEVEQK